MRNITETVKHLLIINGIFFLATLTLGNQVYDWFALHYPTNSKFEYWQPLTHMFMHGDFSHIFFNMFGLWMFGTPLEQMWGKQKFIFFYVSKFQCFPNFQIYNCSPTFSIYFHIFIFSFYQTCSHMFSFVLFV